MYIHSCHTALTILGSGNSLIAFEPGMYLSFFFFFVAVVGVFFWLSQSIRCDQKSYFLHVVGTLAASFSAV